MKKTTAFLLIAVVIAVLGIGAYSLLSALLSERQQERMIRDTSDAANLEHTIRLAGDGWIGYSVLRSPQFQRYLEADGIALEYTDDNANYPERIEKLAAGEYDFIVATLDSYLLNAQPLDYPGVIVFVVDESKGGDGIVANEEIGSLQGLAKPGVKIALTPDSPSDFLLAAVASHFDLAPLKSAGEWRVETDGSRGALQSLRSGAVQAAVLWEPELTEAANDERFTKLLGTEKTEGLILDIAIARREFIAQSPELAEAFIKSYFQALRFYNSEASEFEALVAQDAGVDTSQARTMLSGIEFATLTRNAHKWFGIGPVEIARADLLTSAKANVEVLRETRRLSDDPFRGNFRRIINSSFLENLYNSGLGSGATSSVFTEPGASAEKAAAPVIIDYPMLSAEDWERLNVVGRMKIRPIVFQSGTAFLTLDGKKTIDRMAEDLALYPRFRLLVRGHTTPEGDAKANLTLSQQRAEAVATYLMRVHDVPEARLRVLGVGGEMPLEREDGESIRAWKGRQSRVELLLVEDPTLE